MRIFLAGASGVIGQRLIPRLVQAGHVVGGMTRSLGKTKLLSELGAEPIGCDVFDREALIQAVRKFQPDVLLNELTDLPDDAGTYREQQVPAEPRIQIDRAAELTVEALDAATGVVVIVD